MFLLWKREKKTEAGKENVGEYAKGEREKRIKECC